MPAAILHTIIGPNTRPNVMCLHLIRALGFVVQSWGPQTAWEITHSVGGGSVPTEQNPTSRASGSTSNGPVRYGPMKSKRTDQRTEADFSFLIRWEIPRLCRGGSRSLTIPGVRLSR